MEFRLKFWLFTIVGLCWCWTSSVMAADGNLDKRLSKKDDLLNELLLCAPETPIEVLENIVAKYRFPYDESPDNFSLVQSSDFLNARLKPFRIYFFVKYREKKLEEIKKLSELKKIYYAKVSDPLEYELWLEGDSAARIKAKRLLCEHAQSYQVRGYSIEDYTNEKQLACERWATHNHANGSIGTLIFEKWDDTCDAKVIIMSDTHSEKRLQEKLEQFELGIKKPLSFNQDHTKAIKAALKDLRGFRRAKCKKVEWFIINDKLYVCGEKRDEFINKLFEKSKQLFIY